VVILSPRGDRVALIAGALTHQGCITHTATSLADASDQRLWDRAHVVLLDWAPYEHDTPEEALEGVAAALPRIPVVVIVDPYQPRDGVKAMAHHAAGIILGDRLTERYLTQVVKDAYNRSLAPPPKPPSPRVTKECLAIVDGMVRRYGDKVTR